MNRNAEVAALILFQPRRDDHISYRYVGSATLECWEDGRIRPIPTMEERAAWHAKLLTTEQLEAMSDAELAHLKELWITNERAEQLFKETVRCFS